MSMPEMIKSFNADTDHVVNFIVIENPFECEKRKQIARPWFEGATLDTYLDGLDGDWVICVNGGMVEFSEASSVQLEPNSFVGLTPIPQGGGGGGNGGDQNKSIYRLIAMVVLTYFTFGAGTVFQLGTTGGFLAASAVYIGGTLAINKFLGPEFKDPKTLKQVDSYGIDGPKNTSLEGISVPLVYGDYRVGGNIIGIDVENTTPHEQTLYMLLNAGEGEIGGIEDIEIDDVNVSNYQRLVDGVSTRNAVTTYVRRGGAADQPVEHFDDIRTIQSPNFALQMNSDDYSATSMSFTTDEDCERLRFDFVCPDGIWSVVNDPRSSSHGEIRSSFTAARIWIRELDPATKMPLISGLTGWRRLSDNCAVIRNTLYSDGYNDEVTQIFQDSHDQYPDWWPNRPDADDVIPGPNQYWNRLEHAYFLDENGAHWNTKPNKHRISPGTIKAAGNPYNKTERMLVATVDGVENTVIGCWHASTIEHYAEQGAFLPAYLASEVAFGVTDETRGTYRWSAHSANLGAGCYEVLVVGGGFTPEYIDLKQEDRDEIKRNYPNFAKTVYDGVRFGADCKTVSILSNFVQVKSGSISYKHTAKLGLKVELGNKINRIPKVTFLHKGIKIKVWNKYLQEWDEDLLPVSNPAWVAYDMLTNTRYGAGIPEERMVIDHFSEWADYCTEKGLEFNGVIDNEESVWDSIRPVFRAGRATILNVGTRYGVSIYKPKTPTMMFTSANIVKGSFSSTWTPTSERANQIDVTFYDKNDGYKPRTIRISDTASLEKGLPPRTTEMNLIGVTNEVQARKEGILAINTNKLSQMVSFEANLDSIACTVGDVILVQHDMPQWGYSGRLKSGSTTTTLELDRKVELSGEYQNKVNVLLDAYEVGEGVVQSLLGEKVHLTNLPKPQMQNAIAFFNDTKGIELTGARMTHDNTIYFETSEAASASVSSGDVIKMYALDYVYEANVTYQSGEVEQVQLADPLPSAPSEYANWSVGYTGNIIKPFSVMSITGSDLDTKTISALEYDEAVYDDEIIEAVPDYSGLTTLVEPVTNLKLTELVKYEGYTHKKLTVLVSWDAPESVKNVKVYISWDGGPYKLYAESPTGVKFGAAIGDTVSVVAVSVNELGDELPFAGSPTISKLITGIAIPPPLRPRALASSVTHNGAEISWDFDQDGAASTAHLYELWGAERPKNPDDTFGPAPTFVNPYDENATGTNEFAKLVQTNASSYTHTALNPDAEYHYIVVAKDNQYQEVVSDVSDVLVVSTPPTPPTEFIAPGAVDFGTLDATLGGRIDLIDTTVIDGVAGGLVQANQERENAHAALETLHNTLQSAHDALDSQVSSQGSSIASLQTTTSNQASDISSLTTRVGDAESDIVNLQSTTAASASDISALQSQINSSNVNLMPNFNFEGTFADHLGPNSSISSSASEGAANVYSGTGVLKVSGATQYADIWTQRTSDGFPPFEESQAYTIGFWVKNTTTSAIAVGYPGGGGYGVLNVSANSGWVWKTSKFTVPNGFMTYEDGDAIPYEVRSAITWDGSLYIDRVVLIRGHHDLDGTETFTSNEAAFTSASALDSVETRVTAGEAAIVSHGSRLDSLETSMTDAEGNITANSSAITSVTTRVTDAEGDISAQATSISSLQATVGSHTSSIDNLNTVTSDQATSIERLQTVSPNNGGSLVVNSDMTMVDENDRPLGIVPCYSTSSYAIIDYLDAEKTIARVSSSDTSIGVAWPAFRVDPDNSYKIFIRVKSSATSTEGFYFRIQELDSELPSGKTHVSHAASGSASVCVEDTRQITSFRENAPIGTSWEEYTFTYTPTSTAKWVSPIMLNWLGMGTSALHIDQLVITPTTNLSTVNNSISTLNTTTSNHATRLTAVESESSDSQSRVATLESTSSNHASRLSTVESQTSSQASSISSLQTADSDMAESIQQIVHRTYNMDNSTNLLDTTDWKVGTSGSQTSSDGNDWNRAGTVEENKIVNGIGPYGPAPLWKSDADTNNDGDGGWYKNFACDATKKYRLICWYRRNTMSGGTVYLGCHPSTTENVNGTANTNPYHLSVSTSAISAAGVQPGEWFAIVGVIHEAGYSGAKSGISGLYNAKGEKLIGGSDFRMTAGATVQRHRAYFYYNTEANQTQWFAEPRVEVMDGTEAPLDDLFGDSVGGRLMGVEVQAQATADAANYALRVEANGNVAGIGLEATDTSTAILFQADKIGFQNSGGSDVLPFSIVGDIVYMNHARINTVEAHRIIHDGDLTDPNKYASLGNTIVDGSLTLNKPGQIKFKDIDPTWRSTLVQIDPDAQATGGGRSVSATPVNGQTYYAAQAGQTGDYKPISSGGAATSISVSVSGGIAFGENHSDTTSAPSITYNVKRRNITDNITETLLSGRSVSGTATNSEPNGEIDIHVSSISDEHNFNPTLPTAGKDYEYYVEVTAKSGDWSTSGVAGGTLILTVSETLGSSGGVLVENLAYNGSTRMAAGANGVSVVGGNLYVDNFSKLVISNAGNVYTDNIQPRNGQQIVINAGESANYATGQTNEHAYVNAESGLVVSASPDNWTSGWAGRVVTVIDSGGITWNGNKVWHAGNDGSGSGLDADLLDGNHASVFAKLAGDQVYSGNKHFFATDTTGVYGSTAIEIKEVNQVGTNQSADNYAPAMSWHWGGRKQTKMFLASDGELYVQGSNWGKSRVWHAGNDGSASGLDADKLDGLEGWAYARYAAGGGENDCLARAAWVANYTDASNVDHVWFDDVDNVFHFTADSAFKATGNANLKANQFDGKHIGTLYGAASGAPDVAIFNPSPDYTTYGIFYNEGTPDKIEFKENGAVNAWVALDGTSQFQTVTALSAMTVLATTPVLTIRDSNNVWGSAMTGWISYKDSAGTEKGYVGYASSGTTDFHITSHSGDIRLDSGGGTQLRLSGANADFKVSTTLLGVELLDNRSEARDDGVLLDLSNIIEKEMPQAAFAAAHSPMAGSWPTEFVQVTDNNVPFSKAWRCNNAYRNFYSDYIPVEAGETIYGELWAKGAGTSLIYFGIEQFDKDLKPIATNSGCSYFVVGGTAQSNAGWVKYSSTRTLPTTHTAYNGSDGGAVRYIRARILLNYNDGNGIREYGGIKLLKSKKMYAPTIVDYLEVGNKGTTGDNRARGLLLESYSATDGEAMGRIHFTENNAGSDTNNHAYGFSLNYDGIGSSAAFPRSGASGLNSNSKFAIRRHDNNVNGQDWIWGWRGSNTVNVISLNSTADSYFKANVEVTGDLKMVGSDSYIWTPSTAAGKTGLYDGYSGTKVWEYINGGGVDFYKSIYLSGSSISSSQRQAAPRYDTAFHVLQAQNWYGDTNSQTMYLGESGNIIILRGAIRASGSSSRIEMGYNHGVANSIGCSNWFRSTGNTGWYSGTYGGGIYMTDSSYVRVYNNKAFRIDNTADSALYIPSGGIQALSFNSLAPINPNIDTYRQNAFWITTITNVDAGTVPASYCAIANLGNSNNQGMQLAAAYSTDNDGFWVRRRSDNAGSENGASAWQNWRQFALQNETVQFDHVKLGAGGELRATYNNGYIVKDHDNGNVTLSAAGANLYLGYLNTNYVLLSSTLRNAAANFNILNSAGSLLNLHKTGGNISDTNISINAATGSIIIDTSSSGSYTVLGEQAGALSIGESAQGGASVHLTYTGNGYGHLGMGEITNGIPQYRALRMHYQSNKAEFDGLVYARSHAHGTNYSKVMTWDDFNPALNPPADMEGVISTHWLAAGAVTANIIGAHQINTTHLRIDAGVDVDANGDIVHSGNVALVLNPQSDTPIELLEVTRDVNNVVTSSKSIFSVGSVADDPDSGTGLIPGAIVQGKAGYKFVRSHDAISDSVKRGIYPYYNGNGASVSTAGGTISHTNTRSVTITPTGDSDTYDISIRQRLRVSAHSNGQGSPTSFEKPVWRVVVFRGTTSGTVIHDETYSGSAYNHAEPLGMGTYFYSGSANITIDLAVVDPGRPKVAQQYTIQYHRIHASGGDTPITLDGEDLVAELPSFTVNQFDTNSSGGYSWTDKETGFTVKSGTVSVPGDTSVNVTFTDAFGSIHSAVTIGNNTSTGDWASGSVTSMLTSRITILNQKGQTLSMRWIATGYTAV